MKLASYQDGTRDGQLVVVDRHLKTACYATGIASKLQQALDDWNFISPQLQDLYDALNQGRARHSFAFNPLMCLAPLPRAYQCLSAQPWSQHQQLQQLLAQHLAAQTQTQTQTHAPQPAPTQAASQSSSDWLYGAHSAITTPGIHAELDFEAGIAAITGDIAQGASPEQTLESVRLLALCSRLVMRKPTHARHSSTTKAAAKAAAKTPATLTLPQPYTAFSPVAITPDELGEHWQEGRAHLTLHTAINGRAIGRCDMACDMDTGLHQIIAQACQQRPLRAGSIIHAAPVSNQNTQKGFACLLDKRTSETLQHGSASTNYLCADDILRVSAENKQGANLFGTIEQTCLDANMAQNQL